MYIKTLAIALGLLQVLSADAKDTTTTTKKTTTTTKKTTTTTKKPDPPTTSAACAEFTVDSCTDEAKDAFRTTHDTLTIAACQGLCEDYPKCKSYIFDRKNTRCHLYAMDYTPTCDTQGMPYDHKKAVKDQPTQASCKDAKDPCDGFENQVCQFNGDLLDHFPEVGTADTCKKICSHMPNCQYIVYDTKTQDCELRKNPSFKCDLFKGSKDKTYTTDCDKSTV